MKNIQHTLVALVAMFIVVTTLSPNPYGNNPDIIVDESYFLTSSLSAIQKGTLPGWEFSYSGNYYGGVQTYIDTLAILPIITAIVLKSGFSILTTKVYIALHTGELLHFLRLINGATALFALAGSIFFFRKKQIPQTLGLTLSLFAILLLSDVLLLQMLHTAKVWVTHLMLMAVASALFIAQQYYQTHQSHLGQPFMKKDRYVALLFWMGVLAFCQNYVGAASIGLIGIYALALKHFTFADLWRHVKKYWYWVIVAGITQISFIYRAIFMNWMSGSFSNISYKSDDVHIDWLSRIYKPAITAVQSQPLVFLYIVLALIGIYFLMKKFDDSATNQKKDRLYLLIACTHPIFVYLIFHIAIGFGSAPRYSVIFTTACAFSIAVLAELLDARISEQGVCIRWSGIVLASTLFLVIGTQSISLYWKPSTEKLLLETLMKKYNDPSIAFVEHWSALRMTLPVNDRSMLILDPKRQSMGRFDFLMQHPGVVKEQVAFKPLTYLAYNQEELGTIMKKLTSPETNLGTKTIWLITQDDERPCNATELEKQTCFHSEGRYRWTPQEPHPLREFLQAEHLGSLYTIRKVR
ncbi:MAG: hypothetical protein WCO79_02750 [bacterium]